MRSGPPQGGGEGAKELGILGTVREAMHDRPARRERTWPAGPDAANGGAGRGRAVGTAIRLWNGVAATMMNSGGESTRQLVLLR